MYTPAVSHVAQHHHAVQFYETDQFLCGVVARFLAEGLHDGAPVSAFITASHRVMLERELHLLGLDPDEAIARRQLKLCDAHETLDAFMLDGRPDRTRFFHCVGGLLAQLDGGRHDAHPRAYGEMVEVLWKAGRASAALELEELWNELIRGRSLSLLCAYGMDNFAVGSDSSAFDRICSSHTHVVPTERYAETGALDARYREIAQLQQRARALENEVARRARAEQALRAREAQLSEQNEQLSIALRAKDDFLAMLGHELRNPLAPILLAVDLMRQGPDGSYEHEVIDRQAKHLVRLVDDLLDMARLARGKAVLQKQVVPVRELVARGIELVLPPGHPRHADLELQLPDDLCIEVDPSRMAQVLTNLLANAVKYSDAGSKIVVSACAAEGQLQLSVRDQGIGIEPALIERVFELFVQQPQALDRADGGLGLGLPIVRDIVRLHGGTVSAHSAGIGRGTELRVCLPLPDPLGKVIEAATMRAGLVASAPVQLRRILIVDDNEDAARLLARVLERAGHDVAVANDSTDALELAASFAPEVALLDLGLPHIDGYEVGCRLRARNADVRLIAISGYGDHASRARSAAAGFEAHLVKPVSTDELGQLL